MMITASTKMTPASVDPTITPAPILPFLVGVDLLTVPLGFEGPGIGGGDLVICTLRYAEEL